MSDMASKALLDALHGMLAESMTKALEDGEVSPAGWAAISKFLRDNGVLASTGLGKDAGDKFADLMARAAKSIEDYEGGSLTNRH